MVSKNDKGHNSKKTLDGTEKEKSTFTKDNEATSTIKQVEKTMKRMSVSPAWTSQFKAIEDAKMFMNMSVPPIRTSQLKAFKDAQRFMKVSPPLVGTSQLKAFKDAQRSIIERQTRAFELISPPSAPQAPIQLKYGSPVSGIAEAPALPDYSERDGELDEIDPEKIAADKRTVRNERAVMYASLTFTVIAVAIVVYVTFWRQ